MNGIRLTDREVDRYLTELRDGNPDALEKLYEGTANPLFALCYSYFHNTQDSEDALSESFIAIKTEIGKYKGSSGFNWIYTITKNICLKNLNRAGKVKSVDFTNTVAVDKYYGDVGEDAPIAFDETGIVRLSKQVLKPHEYEIVFLHAVYSLQLKEIAKLTGKMETTVRWQYRNAINKVKKAYERRYGKDDKERN